MIYLDNAATTMVDQKYLDIFCKYQLESFYNPSAPYSHALDVTKDLNNARMRILDALSGDGKIIFTSGGTESDNLALLGTKKAKKARIIISATEHPAVYNTAMELKQRGYEIVEAPVDGVGRVIFDEFVKLVDENTALVSIMHINNETGAVNDIEKLVKYVKTNYPKVIFHSDGVQAVGKIPVNLIALGVDAYSISGHKLHVPKGIGALYVKKGVNLQPVIYGGGQEGGLRSSTENVGGAIALSHAIKDATTGMEEKVGRVASYADHLIDALSHLDTDIKVIHDDNCSPFVICFASDKIKGEVLVRSMEMQGVVLGSGSACSSRKSVKRVPKAIGVPSKYLDGIIRVSFGEKTSFSDIEYCEKHLNQEYIKLKNIR